MFYFIPQIGQSDCGFACLKMLIAHLYDNQDALYLKQDENHGPYSFKELKDIGELYGVIPYTEKLQKQIVSHFKLMISLDCMVTLLDKDGKVVAFGFGLPSLAKAVQKSKGKLDLMGIIRILHAVRHVKVFDFGLIAVRPEYQGKGLTGIIIQQMVEQMSKYDLEYCETNHSLETNQKIILTWKNFKDCRQHKRRRCYVKKL